MGWAPAVMVDIQMRLWKAGLGWLGGRPGWLHLVSETCAPLAPCTQVLRHLHDGNAAGNETSYILDSRYGDAIDPRKVAKRREHASTPAYQHVIKASQWSTVWHKHARWLVANNASIRERWMSYKRPTVCVAFMCRRGERLPK